NQVPPGGRGKQTKTQPTQTGFLTEPPMASNNTASIAQARKLVEQLKMEANIDRIKELHKTTDKTVKVQSLT
uniref:G protein gamma domain-containing protein n=1 Tax=Cyprinodon variegatus TaxID=28743 RepID=A0A3Q2DHE3_CYPVA